MNKDTLNKVLVALGLVEAAAPKKFAAEATLADGTVITADAFEVGNPIYVLSTDGTPTPAAEGTITTEEYTITVDANGVISAIVPVTTESEAETTDSEDTTDSVPENDTLTAIIDALAKISEELNKMKTTMSAIEEKTKNTDIKLAKIAKAPGAEKVKTGAAESKAFAFRNEAISASERKMEILKNLRKANA